MAKTILLVGAAGGVGMATAAALTRRGYKVLATVFDENEAAALRSAVPDVASVDHLDLSHADEAKRRLVDLLAAADTLIDAVVVCSGIVQYGPVETSALADLRRILEINTVAVVAIFQATMPYLRQSRGRFVVVSSSTGIVPFPLYGFYSASKHAVEGVADAMRMEARRWGVEVCLVEPGGIRTPMVSGIVATIDARIAGLPEAEQEFYADLFDNYRQAIIGGQAAYLAPEDVAASLIEAVEAALPSTRRLIGDDAVAAVNMKRTISDRELDAFFLGQGPTVDAAIDRGPALAVADGERRDDG